MEVAVDRDLECTYLNECAHLNLMRGPSDILELKSGQHSQTAHEAKVAGRTNTTKKLLQMRKTEFEAIKEVTRFCQQKLHDHLFSELVSRLQFQNSSL